MTVSVIKSLKSLDKCLDDYCVIKAVKFFPITRLRRRPRCPDRVVKKELYRHISNYQYQSVYRTLGEVTLALHIISSICTKTYRNIMRLSTVPVKSLKIKRTHRRNTAIPVTKNPNIFPSMQARSVIPSSNTGPFTASLYDIVGGG